MKICHYGCIRSLLCELLYITVIIYSIYIFEEFKSVFFFFLEKNSKVLISKRLLRELILLNILHSS